MHLENIRSAVQPDSQDEDFKLYTSTVSAWDAMYEDCCQARSYIRMEQYIFVDDQAGHRFLRLFCDKARQGVQIRILLDSVGSIGMALSPLLKELQRLGGEVVFYNPVGFLNVIMPARLYPRSHTKMLLIDDTVGHIGSACIDDQMRDWVELHARLTGDLVREINRMLDMSSASTKTQDNKPLDTKALDGAEHAKSMMRYVLNIPTRGRNPVYRELLRAIGSAQESIYLATPYFLPPWRLRHALYKAVRRGVSVQVMISEHTDVKIADLVTRSYFKNLLKHGLKIALYKPAMLHAKYAVVDSRWATIGSTNLDYLSLRHNREGNLIVYDQTHIDMIKDVFEGDLTRSFQVDQEFCEKIPLTEKILGAMGRVIKRIL